MVGLDDFKGLLQPTQCYNSVVHAKESQAPMLMLLLKITPKYAFLIRRRSLNTVPSKCGDLDVSCV